MTPLGFPRRPRRLLEFENDCWISFEKTLIDALRQIQDDDVKRCSIYFAWRLLLAFALVKCLVFPLRVFSTAAAEEKRAPRQVLAGRCQEPRRTALQTYVRVPGPAGPEAIRDQHHSLASRGAGRTMPR